MSYSTAVVSECGLYRYELIRRWGDDPMLEFVMLNPSTADANRDDPTIRRCMGFAKQWGYGALLVRNLFAYRATNPKVLAMVADPVGPENRVYLGNSIAHCTIAAWGAHALAAGDTPKMLKRKNLFCLGVVASGAPRHPLYVRSDTTPVRWPAA